MMEYPVGVLLPYKKWLEIGAGEIDFQTVEYVQSAAKLKCPIILLSLASIDTQTNLCQGMVVANGSATLTKAVPLPRVLYSPNKILKRADIRKWRSLVQSRRYLIINEHHTIRERVLYELIKSQPMLNSLLQEGPDEAEFYFVAFCQKEGSKNWSQILYATKGGRKKMAWEEGLAYQFPSLQNREWEALQLNLKEKVRAMLSLIGVYYPGLYEIALQFTLDNQGQPRFHMLRSKKRTLRDLRRWDKKIWQQALAKPIEIAYSAWKGDKADGPREPVGKIS